MQIAQINAQAQMMQQRAQQFLMEDPDGQAQQMADAQMMLQEQQYAEQEAELDEETAEAEAQTDE
jgi:putative heme iron utilization protein